MKIEIYIATQKDVQISLDDCYKPIIVGASSNKYSNSEYNRDDEGINISDLNKSFCELTGLFWAWKHSDASHIGLMHYRRFLGWKHGFKYKVLGKKDIENMLQQYDVILPRKECLYGTVRHQYEIGQHIEDFAKCREVVKELYPEYISSFDRVSEEDRIYICNIMIMEKNMLDNYCNWLFSVLFELEKRIDISSYTKQESRVFGFLAERLLNVWLEYNKPKICEMDLINIETTFKSGIVKKIHLFNYLVLKIDVLEYSRKRVNRKNEKQNYSF